MTDLIERELELSATPEEVWQALTEPGFLSSWLAEDVLLECWPGGEARFGFGSEIREGWVEEATPPRSGDGSGTSGRLSFWWQGRDEPASRVSLELAAVRGGTRLRVSEERPLEILDLVGIPLPGSRGDGARFGPALVAA